MEKFFENNYDNWFNAMYPDGIGIEDIEDFKIELYQFICSIPSVEERCYCLDFIFNTNLLLKLKKVIEND